MSIGAKEFTSKKRDEQTKNTQAEGREDGKKKEELQKDTNLI